jgi:hypothetical protein
MSEDSKLPNARAALVVPYTGVIVWADACVRLAEGWFDWQRAVWQPLLDMQAESMRQWSGQAGWPMAPFVPERGGEQLA